MECKRDLSNEEKLKSPVHLRYSCGYCSFLASQKFQVNLHIKLKHKTSDFKIIDLFADNGKNVQSYFKNQKCVPVCSVCSKVFKTPKILKQHILTHYKSKLKCCVCDFVGHKMCQIKEHNKEHLSPQTNSKDVIISNDFSDMKLMLHNISENFENRQRQAVKMHQYQCPECAYACSYNSSFNRHLRLHSGKKPFVCGLCGYCAREAYVLRRHISKEHKGKEVSVLYDSSIEVPYRYSKRSSATSCSDKKCDRSVEETHNGSLFLNKSMKYNANKLNKSNTFCELDDLKTNSDLESCTLSYPNELTQSTGCKENNSIKKSANLHMYKCVDSKESVTTNGYLILPLKNTLGLKPDPLSLGLCSLVQCKEKLKKSALFVRNQSNVEGKSIIPYSNNDYFNSKKVRSMMNKMENGLIQCHICSKVTVYQAFYKHAKTHFGIKPFKCGLCSYRSIEKSKIKIHNAFCHSEKDCLIEILPPYEAHDKTGIKHDFCDNKCKGRKSQKNFQCYLCSKKLSYHTPSIRRHFYSHFNYKPYKCGYCDYASYTFNEPIPSDGNTSVSQRMLKHQVRQHNVTHNLKLKVNRLCIVMPQKLRAMLQELFGG